jgi:hypothetical protein
MKLWECGVATKKDVKAGYLYWRSCDAIWLCVGNCIAKKESEYVFAILRLDKEVSNDDSCEDLVDALQHGMFRKPVVLRVARFQEMYCIGKLIDADDINIWITQLKLSGVTVEIHPYVKRNGYIGDWRKRKKLPKAKNFQIGGTYLKEPVAYMANRIGTIGTYETVWVYKGITNNVHIWDEVKLRVLKPYITGELSNFGMQRNVTRHKVKNQYRNLVEVDMKNYATHDKYIGL